MKCPKCKAVSGDDWSQCGGDCAMPMSLYYNPDTRSRFMRKAGKRKVVYFLKKKKKIDTKVRKMLREKRGQK